MREIQTPCGIGAAPALISQALARLIPCLSGGFGAADPGTGHITVRLDQAELSYRPDEIEFLARNLAALPYIDLPQCLETVRSRRPWRVRAQALKSSDFQSHRQFRESAVYREVYRQKGIEYLLLLPTFNFAPYWVGGFGLQRDAVDFSERERSLLQRVQPLVAAALRNAVLWTQLRDVSDAVCTVLVRRDGRVVEAPERARGWLARYFGASREGWLPEALTRWMAGRRGEPAVEAAAPLRVPGEGGVLMLSWVPAPHEEALETWVLREEPGGPSTRPVALSEREAEVLRWLSEAKTNEEIAIILGLSVNTVRSHVKRVFEKLGVDNRTAAATWALTHLPRSGPRAGAG